MKNDLRFYTSKHAFEVYNENCGDKALFPQKSDMFFWCVALGFKNSPDTIPTALTSNRQGEIHWGAFDEDIQKPFLNMVAVEAVNNFEILAEPDRFRNVVQAYAELGFTILCNHMDGDFKTDKLMEIIINEKFNQ